MNEVSSEFEIFTDNTGLQWKAVEKPCPICFANDTRQIGYRGGKFHRDGKGIQSNIVQCKNCKLFYARPMLLPLGNPYASEGDYFIKHDSEWKQRAGEEMADKIEEIIGYKGSIIEPACGIGDYIIGAQNRGWKARGIEMTESYAAVARENGLDVEVASVEESKYLNEKYDAIILLAILEHLYEPLEMLKIAYKALNPGGVTVINVPNEVSSLVNRLGNLYIKSYGRDWTMSLSPTFSPFHVVGFSPESLRFALDQIGFEVISLTTHSGTNVMPATGWRQGLEHIGLTAALYLGKLSDNIGMGNEILCWARKPLDD